MSYYRQARFRHAQVKRGIRRTRRRLNGFQTPSLRSLGNSIVTDRDNKHNELNNYSMIFAIGAGIVGAFFASSIFGPLGFMVGGVVAYLACTDLLEQQRFLRR